MHEGGTYSDISVIYPPPEAENIVFLDYCMNLDKIMMLLSNGKICLYSFDRAGAQDPLLESVQDEKAIIDHDRRKLTQTISSMMICKTVPLRIDCEIHTEVASEKLAAEVKA